MSIEANVLLLDRGYTSLGVQRLSALPDTNTKLLLRNARRWEAYRVQSVTMVCEGSAAPARVFIVVVRSGTASDAATHYEALMSSCAPRSLT